MKKIETSASITSLILALALLIFNFNQIVTVSEDDEDLDNQLGTSSAIKNGF